VSLIARFDGNGASGRAARTESKAEQAGFVNVEMTYRPQADTYEVTGHLPAAEAQRTVDHILGR
jgi:hypothetical protein